MTDSKEREGLSARAWVDAALRNCLPHGAPPSYRSIDRARYTKRREAVASLTMFDGQTAEVRVRQQGGLVSHRFTSLPGGDVSFEHGQWIRIDPTTLEPVRRPTEALAGKGGGE